MSETPSDTHTGLENAMSITKMSEAIAAYEDMLDEVGGPTHAAGQTFDASRVLREMDPIAYRCGFADWADAEGIDTDELEQDADLPD